MHGRHLARDALDRPACLRALAWTHLQRARAARKDAFQRLQGKYDKDGDGKLSETEKAARRTDMEAKRKETIAKFDKDGDGRLNPEERQAAKAARKAEKEAQETKKG